jgi:hypothetical protein
MSYLALISPKSTSIRLLHSLPSTAWKVYTSSFNTIQHLPSQSFKTLSRTIKYVPAKPVSDGLIFGCRNCRLLRLYSNHGNKAGEVINGKKVDGSKLGKGPKLSKKSDVARLLHLAKPEKWRLSGNVLLILMSVA